MSRPRLWPFHGHNQPNFIIISIFMVYTILFSPFQVLFNRIFILASNNRRSRRRPRRNKVFPQTSIIILCEWGFSFFRNLSVSMESGTFLRTTVELNILAVSIISSMLPSYSDASMETPKPMCMSSIAFDCFSSFIYTASFFGINNVSEFKKRKARLDYFQRGEI